MIKPRQCELSVTVAGLLQHPANEIKSAFRREQELDLAQQAASHTIDSPAAVMPSVLSVPHWKVFLLRRMPEPVNKRLVSSPKARNPTVAGA